ncbi:MAG: hypothetical protein GTO44_09985 [Hydrotalea flava]|nr:hypothetical protein [Hydrotalea flava]NIN15382.1 hypothetical protein [Hydrotalea flava]
MNQQLDLRQLISVLRTEKKLSLLLIVGITASQAVSIMPFMFEHDQYPDYEYTILPYAFDCELDVFPERSAGLDKLEKTPTRNPVKWWLHCASYQLTGYPNALLMPFNVLVLPLVFYLGYYLTNDRMIGMIAMAAMLYNPLYKDWINTGTYDQVWAFFLLLSIVMIFKQTKVGVIPLVISTLTKSMVLLYLPLWLYTSWKIKRDKTLIVAFVIGCAIAGFVIYDQGLINKIVGNQVGFFPENIEEAIVRNFSLFWQVVPILAVFAVLNNTFRAKDKPKNKRLVVIWMLGILVMTPLIHIFTMQGTFSYRYVPFAAFISVFVGMTLVELGNWWVEVQMKKAEKKMQK